MTSALRTTIRIIPMPLSKIGKWFGVELIEVSTTEKLVAAFGGGLSILALIGISRCVLPEAGAAAIIGSMGASAVLLFAVPHGQLSQPWPVIAGHTVSAIIGVTCARFIPQPILAAACASGIAIGAMHQLKCIHPPGGATALTAVIGGSAIHELGYRFVLFPVLSNAIAMVTLAILINSVFKWRRYPAVLNRPASSPVREPTTETSPPTHEEVLAAVKSLDSFVDISEEDLLRLVELLKTHPAKPR